MRVSLASDDSALYVIENVPITLRRSTWTAVRCGRARRARQRIRQAQTAPTPTTPARAAVAARGGAGRLFHRGHHPRDEDAHPAARRAAVGERGHARRDRRPGHAGDGRRGALRSRRADGAGRGAPRRPHHPRQRQHRRLLRGRRARRRAVSARPVQRRAGGGAEGEQRDDLRARRRRGRAEPCQQGGAVGAGPRHHRRDRLVDHRRTTSTWRGAGAGRWPRASTDVRALRRLPRPGGVAALRREPHAGAARGRTTAPRRLRAVRRPRTVDRAFPRSRGPRRRRHHLLRNADVSHARCGCTPPRRWWSTPRAR